MTIGTDIYMFAYGLTYLVVDRTYVFAVLMPNIIYIHHVSVGKTTLRLFIMS